MMIAGGNHTVIKKLLSVARLMRGGDRLDYERSWVNGICFSFRYSTYCCRDFKLSPPLISQPCRFRKAVMADSFPPGGSQGEVAKADTIQRTHLFRGMAGGYEPPLQDSEAFGF